MDTLILHYRATIAGGGGSEDHYIPVPAIGRYRVVRAAFLPRVAVAAHATNTWTAALKATDGEAGTPGSSMGGWTTDSDDADTQAHVVNDKIALSITAANAEVTGGGSILFDIDEGGTAATAFDGVLQIELRKLPDAS